MAGRSLVTSTFSLGSPKAPHGGKPATTTSTNTTSRVGLWLTVSRETLRLSDFSGVSDDGRHLDTKDNATFASKSLSLSLSLPFCC